MFNRLAIDCLLYWGSSRTIFLVIRLERSSQVFQQPDVVSGFEEVTSSAKPLARELKMFPKRVKKLIDQLPHQEVYGHYTHNIVLAH